MEAAGLAIMGTAGSWGRVTTLPAEAGGSVVNSLYRHETSTPGGGLAAMARFGATLTLGAKIGRMLTTTKAPAQGLYLPAK